MWSIWDDPNVGCSKNLICPGNAELFPDPETRFPPHRSGFSSFAAGIMAQVHGCAAVRLRSHVLLYLRMRCRSQPPRRPPARGPSRTLSSSCAATRKQPSLYKHIDSIAGLYRSVSLLAKRELGEALSRAAAGRSGADAIFAMSRAYRLGHPAPTPVRLIADDARHGGCRGRDHHDGRRERTAQVQSSGSPRRLWPHRRWRKTSESRPRIWRNGGRTTSTTEQRFAGVNS